MNPDPDQEAKIDQFAYAVMEGARTLIREEIDALERFVQKTPHASERKAAVAKIATLKATLEKGITSEDILRLLDKVEAKIARRGKE